MGNNILCMQIKRGVISFKIRPCLSRSGIFSLIYCSLNTTIWVRTISQIILSPEQATTCVCIYFDVTCLLARKKLRTERNNSRQSHGSINIYINVKRFMMMVGMVVSLVCTLVVKAHSINDFKNTPVRHKNTLKCQQSCNTSKKTQGTCFMIYFNPTLIFYMLLLLVQKGK